MIGIKKTYKEQFFYSLTGNRYNSLDLFKFLMAIAVIAIHTNPIVTWTNYYAIKFVTTIEGYAVPFFFIVTGFLIKTRLLSIDSQQQDLYIKRYLVRIIKLYCVWTILSFPLSVYGYMRSDNTIMGCIFSYMKYFLCVGKLYNSYHLWYLLAVIYSLTFFLFLYKKISKSYFYFLIGAILYLAVYVINTNSENTFCKVFTFVFNKGGVFTGLLFISIGMLIAESKLCLKKGYSIILMIVIFILKCLINDSSFDEFIVIFESTAFFLFAVSLNLNDSKTWMLFREISQYMYLSHLIIFSCYTLMIIQNPNKLGLDSFIVTVIGSILVSIIILKSRRNDLDDVDNRFS